MKQETKRVNSSIYGDGQFHLNQRTGEYRKKLKRNLMEVKLPSGTTVYEVKYSLNNLKTQKRYSSLEEAEQFMAMCQNLLDRERMSKHSKIDENEILDYPETLLRDIGINSDTEGYYDFIVPEFEERFEQASQVLSPREKAVLIDYYRNMKTLEGVGEDFGITRERIRQIISKSLRKLRHSKYTAILTTPKDKYYLISQEEKDKMIAEFKEKLESDFNNMTYEKALEIINKHNEEEGKAKPNLSEKGIETLDLSIRSTHCLRMANILKIGQLSKIGKDDLLVIRNLGKKSMNEIVSKLSEVGIELQEGRTGHIKRDNNYRMRYYEEIEGE